PGQALCFRRWEPGDAMTTSTFGVSEPLASAAAVTPDVVATPFLAYNAQGFRLGYGGGYYDRTLRALRQSVPGLLAVGLGYAAQDMAALPYDDHDEALDWLVNERGAQQFPRQR
ncbi:MAG: 5-formyltetrahydrofolate cyclo-ligase, partial [Rhodospirillaceae bacterium]|nr:5-formyltetrahydrofolate cyclo-ligase [Rhodospirillaceae bacterium]